MNIILAHEHAHRLRNDGLIESCPVRVYEDSGDIVLLNNQWVINKDQNAMDLSGGDISLIREQLERLRDVFSLSGRRLPVIESQNVAKPEAGSVL